jgi:hypothetical protein
LKFQKDSMKGKWKHKIRKIFDPVSVRSNQRQIIFAVCLAIASILWFLNALSKSYTTNIYYPVKYVNLPKNKFIINEPPQKLQLRVNAHGFTLLRYKLSLAFSPVALNIAGIMDENRIQSGGNINIQSGTILDKITGQISSDIHILDVRPTSLQLMFDSLESRFVPVAGRIEVQYLSRFGQSGDLNIFPPEVEITGPRALVEKTDTIFTQFRLFKNIDSDLEKELRLEIPPQLTVDPDRVLVKVPVDEYTEKSFTLPITIRSLPEGTHVRLFPQEAELSFSIGLRQFSEITSDTLTVFVNWEDIEKGITNLPLYTSEAPKGVKSLKILPQHVEYLFERNKPTP